MQTPPVAIGGIGGSGTRVIAGILQDLGFYLGDDLNESLDNLWFTLLFKRRSLWPTESHGDEIDQLAKLFLKQMTDPHEISGVDLELLQSCVIEATEEHPVTWREERAKRLEHTVSRLTEADGWGWKEPNTHIVLPELISSFPGLRYIHVMRHGVDMALSANQNQLRLWGEGMLGREINPGPLDSLYYWCEVHRRLQNAETRLGSNFLLLNFDDFCRNPREGLQQLTSFLEVNLEIQLVNQLCEKIQVPESLGRHREVDKELFRREDLEFVRGLGFEV